jgi:hypothetical protein
MKGHRVHLLLLGFVVAIVASVTALAGTADRADAASQINDPVPDSVLVVHGGLEWAWASPCNGGCSTPLLRDGFRYATAEEWANRPAYDLFANPEKCASPWLDPTYDHCDSGDLNAGYVASGPNFDQPSCASPENCETLLVRGANTGAILGDLLAQVDCSVVVQGNWRMYAPCYGLRFVLSIIIEVPRLTCIGLPIAMKQVLWMYHRGGISQEVAASWSSSLLAAAANEECPWMPPGVPPPPLEPTAGDATTTLAEQ